jgi:hypothetical protein
MTNGGRPKRKPRRDLMKLQLASLQVNKLRKAGFDYTDIVNYDGNSFL